MPELAPPLSPLAKFIHPTTGRPRDLAVGLEAEARLIEMSPRHSLRSISDAGHSAAAFIFARRKAA